MTKWRRGVRPIAVAAVAVLAGVVAVNALAARTSLATGPVSAFPAPGTPTVGSRAEVSLRGAPADQLGQILVVGSRSGKHAGELKPHSDGQGASFVPDEPFEGGERVTVRTELRIRHARDGDFRFTVAEERNRAKPIGEEPEIPAGEGGADSFRSRPDLRPQSVAVTTREAAAGLGDVFIAPKGDPGQDGPLILDDQGEVVWFKPAGGGRRATDFRVQQYEGRPVLTWWQGRVGFGNGAGDGIIMDSSYRQIARVRAGNGYAIDLHDFVLTPQGTALVLIYQPVRRNLRSIGGSRNGLVVDNIVQEIDIKTGLVLFEWHSIGQVRLSEGGVPRPKSPNVPWDYFHVNSVDVDRDGNLLVSARNTSGVYKLSRATGSILWRLGGERSDFDMGAGTRFKWQHDARRQADGTLTIYDNSAAPPVRKRSRAIRLNVDEQERKATLVRALAHPRGLLSASQGSAQDLPDGSVFVGWGSQRWFSEFGSDGKVVFEGKIAKGADNYRAYRFPWSGRPRTAPAVAAERGAPNDTVYASWNGATEVARWEVLAGSSADAMVPVGGAAKAGFETSVEIPTGAKLYAVRALDASGQALASSKAVAPE
jgi:hypothetical protein